MRSFLYEGSQWLTSDTQYDALGRAWKVSANPYLSSGPGSAVPASGPWVETTFDALRRATHVRTTADNAQVTTSYAGNQVTVADQTGRQRSSVSDALGRLTSVTEAPGILGYGFVTTYAYDALGNLRKVEQGGQTRFFMYDSLGRLTRVRNPEQATNANLATAADPVSGNTQWSTAYDYDPNGNLWRRIDARNVTTTHTYDNLNRVIQTVYSDSTPYTLRTYDFATNGRGRFYADYESSTQGTINYVHAYDAAGRPTSRESDFYLSGTGWVGNYTSSRTYDKMGNVTSQTYPSGRAVTNTQFDAAGRLKAVSGSLGDGTVRTYSDGITYDEAGRVKEERFGTQTPLYHKKHYNVRGQLYDVRLSTYSQQAAPWNWNRGALINYYSQNDINAATNEARALSGPENNGNVKLSQHWVPGNDQITTSNWMSQWYDYDSLNRLSSVKEQPNGGAYTGEQHYAYDRFGNRQINAGATYGTDIPERQFAIDTATNRIGVPATQGGVMVYDNAGNLTADTYSASAAQRAYDAENRMTLEQNSQTSAFHKYAYDAAGKRVRRDVGGNVTWQVYGFDGELLAEYAQNGAPSSPRKEYGYRGGELLVTAQANDPQKLAAFVTAFYQAALNRQPGGAELQSQTGTLGAASQQGPAAFFDAASLMGRTLFLSQGYADRSRNDHWFVYDIYAAFLDRQPDAGGWAAWEGAAASCGRPCVLDAFSSAGNDEWAGQAARQANLVDWLVTDHLGTPRMVADKTGSLEGIRRHDYLPFGEESQAGVGGRTTSQGYSQPDGVRQGYTGYEEDDETGLNFAQARYHSPTQGRFLSPDPFNIVGEVQFERDAEKAKRMLDTYLSEPQQWNRYAYTINNPLRYIDPSGEVITLTGTPQEQPVAFERIKNMLGNERMQYVQCQEINGNLVLSISENDFHKFAAIGPNREEREFSTGMAGVLAHSQVVEFRVAETYEARHGWGRNFNEYKTESESGGVTLDPSQTRTRNIQIFIHPEAGKVAEAARASLESFYLGSGDLIFTNDMGDAHEFGHAHAKLFRAVDKPRTWYRPGARPQPAFAVFENAVRSRYPSGRRRGARH